MMLPPRYLVPRGDVREMAARIVALLRSPEQLAAARLWARARARDFTWERAAAATSDAYREHLAVLRQRRSRQRPSPP